MSDTQQEAWLVDTDTDHEGAELQVHAPLLAPGEGVEHHLTSLSLARRSGQLIQTPSPSLLDMFFNLLYLFPTVHYNTEKCNYGVWPG